MHLFQFASLVVTPYSVHTERLTHLKRGTSQMKEETHVLLKKPFLNFYESVSLYLFTWIHYTTTKASSKGCQLIDSISPTKFRTRPITIPRDCHEQRWTFLNASNFLKVIALGIDINMLPSVPQGNCPSAIEPQSNE